MNTTLDYIQQKFSFDLEGQLPIKIKIDRFRRFPILLRELGFKTGAEIGVAAGRYSRFLCFKIKGLKLFCVDPWLAYDEYVEYHNESEQVIFNAAFEKAKERLAPFDCEFIRKYSIDAAKDFKDESLDFVFIDGNHSFEYVVDDIAAWSKKVRKGGIVAGHDYFNSVDRETLWLTYEATAIEKMKLCQVKDAVDAWAKTNKIRPWFIITEEDTCPTWFWVKQ